ncbi:MAG TPA: helicase C-terminal domain-containing protein, partial [Planctomycetota bacterium]|nr:helicase C-terminal domain-containing protein [Planctomycetota bacterium]
WELRVSDPLAFVQLWTSGPDPSVDGLVRIEALRCDGETLERFERWSNPFPGGAEPAASARMVRELGVQSRDLEQGVSGEVAWAELAAFVGRSSLVVLDAEVFAAWSAHFEKRASERCVLGLAEFSAQWLPGRLASSKEGLIPRLLGSNREHRAPNAISAGDLQSALAELVARVHELEPAALRLAAACCVTIARKLREADETAARRFELGLALVERPSRFLRGTTRLFDAARATGDGGFALALDARELADPFEVVRGAIDALQPAWAPRGEAAREENVPITTDEDKPFDARDLELVDDVFQVHLPAIAAEDGEALRYRAGQHEVAREVARTLGAKELLLVHAPTGTGKTLAYLVPALIWSARHGVRVGVTTYTRALQEQAMDREVPRALRAIDRATALGPNRLPCAPRVALLKGRANYVCWRALALHVPAAEDGHEAWLAWLTLVLFSLRDDAGDFDRLALRAAFGSGNRERETRELETLVRQTRAQVGCCQAREDRKTCGAEAARQRAERSHVVVANHAFALVKQAAFKHVVFDECEHLHEQAHAVWSRAMGIEEVRQLLARIRSEGKSSSRAPLDRLERGAFPGTQAALALESAAEAWRASHAALDELEREVEAFVEWRTKKERTRDARDQHVLLREYVLHGDSAGLVAARASLGTATQALSTGIAQVLECMDTIALRGLPRLRRQVELLRVEVDLLDEILESWMPVRDGAVVFNEHTFYDVELDPRGRRVLAARVLLPNEYLGRHYYPELQNAVLLSATTWLRGGFESAKGYLGLDRAENPAAGEERTASVVRCVRAPDPFDYGRVLVALPNDAPGYGTQRESWHAYVRRFIAHLGERTRGRMLVLFTNQEELRRFGEELSGFFSARRIPFWYQGMRGVAKEELAHLFRGRTDSILMGVDTFWYGADFPGKTLEYLVIVKLPYGVPDRYHHAQCAALGSGVQRRRIYLPRALAKFRQGFGRLMRRESDRGCVFLLDSRAQLPQHRLFLEELPLSGAFDPEGGDAWRSEGARVVRDSTEACVHAALAHMDMLADVRRRGLGGESHVTDAETSAASGREPVDPGEIPF